MRTVLMVMVHIAGWIVLSAVGLIVWVFGLHLWQLLLIPLPFFTLALAIALNEIRLASPKEAKAPMEPRWPF